MAIRQGIALSAIALALCLALPVAADEPDQNRTMCADTSDGIARDAQIAACTALIEAGGEVNESLSVIRFNRGSAYYALTIYTNAIEDFDEAIRLNPDFIAAYYNRGRLYSDLRDHAKAVPDYSQAIRLDPKNADYWYRRCWARAVWGDELSEGLADCDQALKLAPKTAATLTARGMVHLKSRDWAKALADYEAATKLQPTDAGAFYGRGIAKVLLGQVDAGQADMALAAKFDTNIAATYAGYGLVI